MSDSRLSKNFDKWAAGDNYRSLAHNYQPIDLGLIYDEGPWMIGKDGQPYLDFIGGYGANMFGHKHPRIVEAMIRQLRPQEAPSSFLRSHNPRKGGKFEGKIGPGGVSCIPSRNFTFSPLDEFSDKLAEFSLIPDALVLPKNGGGEIFESAVKAMRADGVERRGIPVDQGKIIVFDHNFHGRTASAVAASSSDSVKRNFGPFVGGFIHVPYGDLEALEKAMEENKGFISGVHLEPIQGEAGVVIPPKGYLREVQSLCKKYGTILSLDEVQSGMGRTGKRWAWMHELDEAPDIMIVAKALGAGALASSALIGKREIMKIFTPGSDGATMSGAPLMDTVAIEAMAILEEENLYECAVQIGEHFTAGFAPLADNPLVHDIRVIGAWAVVELEDEEMAVAISNYLTTECQIACTPAHGCIRLSPPLTMPLDFVDLACEHIVDVVQKFEQKPEMVHDFTFSTFA